jgi:hypothetical protein
VPPRFLTSLAAGVLLALTFPTAANAEWHFVPTIGWMFAADTNLFDPDGGTSKVHWNFGGSVALLGAGILGVEGTVVWTPGFFAGNEVTGRRPLVSKSHAFTMMGNMVLTTPRKWTEYNLRPVLSGGFGLLGVSRIDDVYPDTWNTPAFNIGGGAVGFFSKRTGVRFDLRYYNSIHKGDEGCMIASIPPGCHVRYMTASVGVVIRR